MDELSRWRNDENRLRKSHMRMFVQEREIIWCALGINIGIETNGKGKNFLRPVVIMKVYNQQSVVVLPITSSNKKDPFHKEVKVRDIRGFVKLTQTRTISTKRLVKKLGYVSKTDFKEIQLRWIALLK